MRSVKRMTVPFALIIGTTVFFILQTSAAEKASQDSHGFRITINDVVHSDDSVVKQIRVDAKPDCHATITSDKAGGGGLSMTTGHIIGRSEPGAITLTVLADHVSWKAGDVNALKFLMSMQSNGSKTLLSDTGPMSSGKRLDDIVVFTAKAGNYNYDTSVPILRFKERVYSLSVATPATKP